MTTAVRSILLASLVAVSTAAFVAPAAGVAQDTGAKVGRAIDDSVITGKVKSALIADAVTKAHQINVETRHGEVLLSGFVDSKEARSRAAELARTVEGVRSVKNSLELRSAT
jgi:hyperosmotically inducible protein